MYQVTPPTQKKFKFGEILQNIDIADGMVVADFGSGSGFMSIDAARLVGKRGRVYAIDVREAPLNALKGKIDIFGLQNIQTTMADLEVAGDLKIEDGIVDIVIIANLLYQTKKHEIIFSEAKRVCKDNGKILIVDWKKQQLPFGPDVNIRVSKDDVLKEAEGAGLKFIEDVDAGDFFYSMLFNKNN